MATRVEIQKLLKRVNITIDKSDIIPALDKNKKNLIKNESRIEDFLLNNAEYIDMKKLVIIVVKKLQLLVKQYEEAHISKLLENNTKKELENAIKFAKLYVKPDEKIIFIGNEEGQGVNIITSKEVIYGDTNKEDTYRYDEIRKIIPKVDKQSVKSLVNLLKQILNDDDIAKVISYSILQSTLIEQGYSEENMKKICSEVGEIEEKIEEFAGVIDLEVFDRVLKMYLEIKGIKENLDVDKYLLFNMQRINEKLEQQEELEDSQKRFLKNIEILLEDVKEKTKIRINQGNVYDKKEVKQFLSKLNSETLEYSTEEQLKKGERLLQDTNGYESYLKKEQLMQLATIEGNLIFLAKNKKISNGNIMKILYKTKVTEDALIELCINGNMTLEQLEKYGTEKGMDTETLKKKIREKTCNDLSKINVEDKNIWKLLTYDEKIQVISLAMNRGNTKILKEIEELYSSEKIAQLYKEIYIEENSERRNIYDALIKMHNALGNKNSEEIINLLENEFSNEMLLNLYKDNLINIETLESYGGEELIEKAFEEELIQDKDRKELILKSTIKLTEEQVIDSYKKGEITSAEIMEIYLKDKIKLETIKKINTILPEEQKIEKFLEEEELLSLYKQSKGKKDSEKQAKYQRYRLLYQALKEEKLEENLLKEWKLFKEEDIVQLYRDNMLNLNTLLAYGGEEFVQKLAMKVYLTPSDAKEFFKEQEGKRKIEEILQNPEMEEIQKIILIYSTYADDKKMRDELVKYLPAHATDLNGESQGREAKNLNQKQNLKNETNTDPYERWRLLLALDKNYTIEYIDGYIIAHLNTRQKTIVEKMYKKYKGKVIPAYGVATFDIDTDEYIKIEKQIIKGKRIDISVLRKLSKEEPEIVGKTTHHAPVKDKDGNEKTSWGKRIVKRVIGENLEEIYTKEEKEEIENCLRAIEASREEFEH